MHRRRVFGVHQGHVELVLWLPADERNILESQIGALQAVRTVTRQASNVQHGLDYSKNGAVFEAGAAGVRDAGGELEVAI